MADRPNLLQRGQYAIEATAGTLIPATKRFVGVDIRPTIVEDRYAIYGTGDIVPRGAGTNFKRTDLSLSGTPGFDELVPLLSLWLGTPAFTTPAGATNARQAQWELKNGTINTPKTMSYEWGDANHAMAVAYVYGRDLTFNIARGGGGVTLTGALEGQGSIDQALSGGAADLPIVPIEGVNADVYSDTTYAGIGVTKLLREFTAAFTLNGLNSSFMALNSAQTSFAGIVPTRPTSNASLRVGADAIGLALARDGLIRYVRFEVKGAEIDSGIALSRYRLTIDLCLKMQDPGAFDDETGLLVIPPTFMLINDATAGFGARIQVVSTQTAL